MKRQIIGTFGRIISCASVLLVASGACWVTQSAQATCVAPMNMAALADGAGQVLVGRIASVRSYWTANPRTIESEVTLDQVEYLKGQPGSLITNTFSLRVPGGSVDGTTLQLCGTPTLRIGQTWLLFLQPTYKTYPVVGFSQGAFQLVEQAGGTRIVQTSSGSAVLGLDNTGYVRLAGKHNVVMDRLRAMHRVRIVNVKPTQASRPIDWPSFRKLIEPILARSTNHHLTIPAGQPSASTMTPTSFQRSLDSSANPEPEPETATGRSVMVPPLAKARSAKVSQKSRRMTTDPSVVPRRDVMPRSRRREAHR